MSALLRRRPAAARREEPQPGTDAVDLSLRIVEHLAAARGPVGVSEMARALDSSKATIYRHLQTLTRRGFARQDAATLRYEAGIKLLILGERLRERFDILAIARDEMARLRERSGQAVTLSTLSGGEVVVLEVLQGHAIVNFGTQPGTVLDLHASAHGKVALAFGPEPVRERCLRGALRAHTSHTICARPALERAIAQVRSHGWATAPNQVIEGVNGLAAPIFDHQSNYAGAIAIAGSIQHIPASPARAQIAAVTEAARQISLRLGWRSA